MDCDIILRPILPTAYDGAPHGVLYKISIGAYFFLFLVSNTGVELIRCSAALFTGCMLIMYN